jgi:hypothetical protein
MSHLRCSRTRLSIASSGFDNGTAGKPHRYTAECRRKSEICLFVTTLAKEEPNEGPSFTSECLPTHLTRNHDIRCPCRTEVYPIHASCSLRGSGEVGPNPNNFSAPGTLPGHRD